MKLAAFCLVVMTGIASLKRFMINKPKIKINSQPPMNQTYMLNVPQTRRKSLSIAGNVELKLQNPG